MVRKMEAEHSVITGPTGRPFLRKEKKQPVNPLTAPKTPDNKRSLSILMVMSAAVAAGMISRADTRTTPMIWSEETIQKVSSADKENSKSPTGRPMDLAKEGSKPVANNSLLNKTNVPRTRIKLHTMGNKSPCENPTMDPKR